MTDVTVYQLLQNIRQRLEQAAQSEKGTEAAEMLQQADKLLEHSDDIPEPDEFIMEQLHDLIDTFEAEHPVLTEWLSKLSDQFSKMGI